jgi:hypothetical protein
MKRLQAVRRGRLNPSYVLSTEINLAICSYEDTREETYYVLHFPILVPE